MTANGSVSLNNVFKQSWRLPVVTIVDNTFYKCNACMVCWSANTGLSFIRKESDMVNTGGGEAHKTRE